MESGGDFVTAHLKNPKKVIDNFHKVLKKDGFLLIEFSSIKDPLRKEGKEISRKERIKNGIYVRLYSLSDIKKLLKRFKVISFEQSWYTDPYHGAGYVRKKRHKHHSFFVFAKK